MGDLAAAGNAGPPLWRVLVPVKPFAVGKSRLAGLGPRRRTELARAFALDTLAAAAGASRVGWVGAVTDEPLLREAAAELGIAVLPDLGGGDLNAALRVAAGQWSPQGAAGVAVLTADLPMLDPHELDQALAEAERHGRVFAPDAQGRGTTLLTARAGRVLEPRFGSGSALRHRLTGARDLPMRTAGLSRDIDTPGDLLLLDPARCGRHTRALLATAPTLVRGR